MALNLKELTNFILPLVQSGKEEEAKQLLAQAGNKPPASRSASAKSDKDGLLDTVGSLLSGGSNAGGNLLGLGAMGNLLGGSSGGGLLDSLGGVLGNNGGDLLSSIGGLLGTGDAGPLSGLLSVLPALLRLIRPEHIKTVADHLTGIVNKGKKAAAGSTAKRGTAKKPAASTKATGAKTAGGVKKTIAPKKPAGGARKPAPAKPRPPARRPARP